jgi:hypothetical protein
MAAIGCKFRGQSAVQILLTGIPTRNVIRSNNGRAGVYETAAYISKFQRNSTHERAVCLVHRLLVDVRSPSSGVGGFMSPEPTRTNDEVLRRVQGEFLEMPGLRLTTRQARRLWGLDASQCDALLGALVEANFLFRTRDGAFMRVEHAAPLKASLSSRRGIAAA